MTPRRRTSAELYDAAFATLDAARAESRAEYAAMEARIAKLKLAATLEEQGRMKEAERVIREVEREQRRLGMRP